VHGRPAKDAGEARVVVYGAAGCSLCAPAVAVVRAVAAPLGLAVAVVAIDGDPDLERRYRERIPVVEVDGRPVAKFHVDPGVLEARLRGLDR